jgi:hypothetical protein
LRAQIPPPERTDCCAMVTKAAVHDTTRHGCPTDPIQQKQCCAACAMALTLFLATSSSFISPTPPAETLPDRTTHASLRAERPPVPPPRLLAARNATVHRTPWRAGGRFSEIQQRSFMKHFLLIVAFATAIGLTQASGSSPKSGSCCNGGACCGPKHACCSGVHK